MPFEGAQRMVMKAITKLQEQPGTPVDDAWIAQETNIALKDVRDWMFDVDERPLRRSGTQSTRLRRVHR